MSDTTTIPEGLKPVLVTTQFRGVFAGLVPLDQPMDVETVALKDGRVAIYWNTKRGVLELAKIGPNRGSRIGLPADIPMLRKVTMIADLTAEAWAKWVEFGNG